MMSDRIATRQQLTLVGLGLRTNDAAELAGFGKIAAAWRAFVEEKVQARIPNQVHATATYVAYYDYEGAQKENYSYLLGAAVRDGTPAPEGMTCLVVPAAKYLVVEVLSAAEVPAAWRGIADAGLHRTFTTDLECHRHRQKVEIYVAVA